MSTRIAALLMFGLLLSVFANHAIAQCKLQEFSGSQVAASSQFGDTLALDGARLATTSRNDDTVYVFDQMADGTWQESAVILPGRFVGDLALDDDTLVLCDVLTSVLVYELQSGSWTMTQTLNGDGPGNFCESVDIDGNTIVVGAPREDFNNEGAAYIFEKQGTTWTQVDKLVSPSSDGIDEFGQAVALASGALAISAPGEKGGTLADPGAVYVYFETPFGWIHTQTIQATDGSDDEDFGKAIALSQDGITLVIGSESDDTMGTSAGAAFVHQNTGGGFIETGKLLPSDPGPFDEFGASVAVVNNNTVALASNSSDSVYLFEYTTSWEETMRLIKGDSNGDTGFWIFGENIALTDNQLLVTADTEDDVATDAGAIHVFSTDLSNCPLLFGDFEFASLSGGGAQTLTVNAGEQYANSFYWILGSTSGTSPGTPLPGATLPLNSPDDLFTQTLNFPAGPPVFNGAGVLDSNGQALATVTIAAGTNPSLSGATMNFAYFVFDPLTLTIRLVSNPVPLDLID